ncbi:MAG: DUF3570 domain-containing protein [Myxococcales bacterium]|nr:DUF3570 domain-containing protein [Myxococcales bacterium]
MRLRLTPRRWRSGLAALALGTAVSGLAAPRPLAAEDRILLRGNYYREASTRILAPEVVVSKDLPDERFNVGVGYLLDAVSSASIAAGAAAVTGGDRVFTEMRHGTTVSANSKLGDNYLSAFFRHSTESDYRGRMLGASYARDVLQRSGTISATYSYSFDRAFWIRANIRDLHPWTSTGDTNLLQVHYLNLGYTHALHPTVLAGLNVEGIVARGPQDNPYRKVLNGLDESHPLLRQRLAPSVFVRWALPKARLVIEPRYRYYADDWGIRAHAIDTRIHIRATRNLLFRLRYRYYTQSGAFFWTEDGFFEHDAPYRTADPKVSRFLSHTPGAQVAFRMDPLAERVEALHFLRGAWIQATYNHVFQTNRFGNARLGSVSLSMPF